MPSSFDRRVRIDSGNVVTETVYLHDSDAADYWRFDCACHTPRALRNLVVVWNAALTQEGGLGWQKVEDMMDVVAQKFDDEFTHPPHWSLPNELGGDTAMVLPRHDLHCNTEYSYVELYTLAMFTRDALICFNVADSIGDIVDTELLCGGYYTERISLGKKVNCLEKLTDSSCFVPLHKIGLALADYYQYMSCAFDWEPIESRLAKTLPNFIEEDPPATPIKPRDLDRPLGSYKTYTRHRSRSTVGSAPARPTTPFCCEAAKAVKALLLRAPPLVCQLFCGKDRVSLSCLSVSLQMHWARALAGRLNA